MSWLGYKGISSKPAEPSDSPRTAKRNKLQAERLQRSQQREKLRQQLKAAQEARDEANLAEAELLALDPSIFEDNSENVEVSEDILEDDIMADDFDVENGTDGDKALDKFDLKIENDITCATSDGASVMTKWGKMISCLHVKCMAHAVHLGKAMKSS